MWHKIEIAAFNVVLKPLEIQDLEQLRQWRNSPGITSQMLDQSKITREQQQQWFKRIRDDRRQMQFVIYYKNQPVGACNLKSSSALTIAECASLNTGFYLGEAKYRGTILAFFAALALNKYSFEQLKVESLKAQVKISNHAALRFNQQLGYQIDAEQDIDNMINMTLIPQHHLVAVTKFATFIRN